MRRTHMAIGVTDIAASVTDCSRRPGAVPPIVVPGECALWRTDALNLSIRRVGAGAGGQPRHLGWEDDACAAFRVETDVNGMAWECFTTRQQAEEIRAAWPDADHSP